jgi:hypothetical protein
MADAMSFGVPIRPRACIALEAFSAASFEVIRAASGVSTSPGATQFTRIPRAA